MVVEIVAMTMTTTTEEERTYFFQLEMEIVVAQEDEEAYKRSNTQYYPQIVVLDECTRDLEPR